MKMVSGLKTFQIFQNLCQFILLFTNSFALKKEQIEDAVINPTQVVDGYGDRKVAHKKFFRDDKEYLLRVVYEETQDGYTVVTAYITSQINRYWKEEA